MLDSVGSPLMEMFLRREPDGTIQRRLAALRGYDLEEIDGASQLLAASLTALANGEGTLTVREYERVHKSVCDSCL